MAYRVQDCAQCGVQIAVKDVEGKLHAKPNRTQITLTFANGMRFKVPVCKDCVNAADYSKILAKITEDGSELFGKVARKIYDEHLKDLQPTNS